MSIEFSFMRQLFFKTALKSFMACFRFVPCCAHYDAFLHCSCLDEGAVIKTGAGAETKGGKRSDRNLFDFIYLEQKTSTKEIFQKTEVTVQRKASKAVYEKLKKIRLFILSI